MNRRSLEYRLARDVKRGLPDECWEWQGYRNRKGYGQTSYHGKARLAHRVVYAETVGDPGDLSVCHTCDNPPCCSPAHLFLGTQADNVRDMHNKGRNVHDAGRGATRANRKLLDLDILDIRSSHLSNAELARRYGVTPSAIWYVRSGRIWKHVTDSDNSSHSE